MATFPLPDFLPVLIDTIKGIVDGCCLSLEKLLFGEKNWFTQEGGEYSTGIRTISLTTLSTNVETCLGELKISVRRNNLIINKRIKRTSSGLTETIVKLNKELLMIDVSSDTIHMSFFLSYIHQLPQSKAS